LNVHCFDLRSEKGKERRKGEIIKEKWKIKNHLIKVLGLFPLLQSLQGRREAHAPASHSQLLRRPIAAADNRRHRHPPSRVVQFRHSFSLSGFLSIFVDKTIVVYSSNCSAPLSYPN